MKFINISNQMYYLTELKRLVKAEPQIEVEFSEEEMEYCPLLRDLINQGSIIPVATSELNNVDMGQVRILGATDDQLQDGSLQQELAESQVNHNSKSPTNTDGTYDVGGTQVPVFHTQESPLVETQPERDILIDEYQRSHQKSLYDDNSAGQKKN